jgi:hypothetical protein
MCSSWNGYGRYSSRYETENTDAQLDAETVDVAEVVEEAHEGGGLAIRAMANIVQAV